MTSNPFVTAQHDYIRPELAEQFAKDDDCNLLIFGDTRYNGREKALMVKMMNDEALRQNANRALGEMTRPITLTHPSNSKQEELHLLLQEIYLRWTDSLREKA